MSDRREPTVDLQQQDRADRGSGVLSTCFGILFFLGFLMVAAQVVVSVYAKTVVTSAALDAGRIVAGAGGPDGAIDGDELVAARRNAEQRVHDLLGDQASFEVISVDRAASRVTVQVSAPRPRLLWGGGALGGPSLTRRVELRLEQLQ